MLILIFFKEINLINKPDTENKTKDFNHIVIQVKA